MVYVFPEGCPGGVNGELADRARLSSEGIVEAVEIAANSQVTYSFEIEAFDALVFDVKSEHPVSIAIRTSQVDRPGQILFLSEDGPADSVCFHAPRNGCYEVDIINRRTSAAPCTVHAVSPLSAFGQAIARPERSSQPQ